MGDIMSSQSVFVSQFHVTNFALIKFLSCVDSSVIFQAILANKLLATQVTVEKFLFLIMGGHMIS